MKDVWQRIERWLAANAPKALQALTPPAAPAMVERLEREIGKPLPDDFRESMFIHDGQSSARLGVFGNWELLDCAHIIDDWRLSRDVNREVQQIAPVPAEGPVRPVWWSDLWVPFTSDGSGNALCLDLDPPENGERGQIVYYRHDAEIRKVVSPDFRTWLSSIANDMESGKYDVTNLGFPRRGD